MKSLSEDDYRRLHEALTAAEQRTSAHFALVIAPVSERYRLFPPIWAAAAAFAAGAVLAIAWPDLPLRIGFLIEAGTLAGLTAIFDWLPLRLRLVPGRVKREHCAAFARREFAARILADHEHRPGLILFVSLGERHIEILADRALHARVGEEAWRQLVADFVAAPKAGQAIVDGLITSIEACGAILELHYPRSATQSA
jgi:putative membrane protein